MESQSRLEHTAEQEYTPELDGRLFDERLT
jgi:hypothetical protein